MAYFPKAKAREDRYKVTVKQYKEYQRTGALKLESLISSEDVSLLLHWADDLLHGRIDIPGIEPAKHNATLEELVSRFTRIHMLHRVQPVGEWGLLHPRILDVLEAIIGPDVLALQTMLFFNPPGKGGQGWHQDSLYIPTYPDTLIGVWIALEEVDEENGCLWVVPGSKHEPVYPESRGSINLHSEGAFEDLQKVENTSNLNDSMNTLSKIVTEYETGAVPVPMKAGDVLLFHSHLLHRSYPNRTIDRFRRAYVCHYCDARSFVPWNHGAPFEGDSANNLHILARGRTHLPFGKPIFGTPVDLSGIEGDSPAESVRLMGTEEGMMEGLEESQVVAGVQKV